ncbi:MAG: cobyrinate a,c-diamide synthase [Pseudomonadota bacterium]
MPSPRLVVAGLSGGAGKTIVSLGIVASFRRMGKKVIPFKKGPDYIDAGWLACAASHPCYNLDTFLSSKEQAFSSFQKQALDGDISLVEGNRGLYDGMDIHGTTSTAELAKLIKSPVLLVIDCTKSTRTIAALVLGCIRFDPEIMIKGVILNRIGGGRHEEIVRQSIEHYTGIKVVGAIPRLKSSIFPERHMGLVPQQESSDAEKAICISGDIAEKHLDIDEILAISGSAPFLNYTDSTCSMEHSEKIHKVRIGVVRDSAFQFYYQENLDALKECGADLVFISALLDSSIPELDALYIGGGFPETHAGVLAANKSFREAVFRLAHNGLPIYAECGGLMYLGEKILMDGAEYPMCGVLPITFGLLKNPQAHGYTDLKVDRKNPIFDIGMRLHGHEFHYSKVVEWRGVHQDLAFKVERGRGICGDRDGVCYKNVLATYSHILALGFPEWTEGMIKSAYASRQFRLGARS